MKKESGITLVALIITVIILVILSAVTIITLQQSEMIKYAVEGTEKYTKGQGEEEKEINALEGIVGNALENIQNGSTGENPGIDPDKPTPPSGPIISDTSGASKPSLDKFAQKTYVTWSLNEAETEYDINDTQTEQPDNWYDYTKGQWANIKTSNEGLEAYWVWVPRYEYIVPTSTTVTEIAVRFIGLDKKEGSTGYTTQSDGTIKSDDGYTIHPAFTNSGNGGLRRTRRNMGSKI